MPNNFNYNNRPSFDRRNQGRNGNKDYEEDKRRQRAEILGSFNKAWISSGIDAAGVDFCQRAAIFLKDNKMSASYIRNIFGELKRIETKGFDKSRTDFYMLRPKVAYSTARATNRDMDMSLFREIFDKIVPLVNDSFTFKNMVNMIEAIIAFHKAEGGKD